MKKHLTITDNELVEKVKSGELDFSIIYNMNLVKGKRFLFKKGASNVEAEDVYQDSMIALYKKILSDDFILTTKLTSFIFSILNNLWLKELKKSSRYINLNTSDFDLDKYEIGKIVVDKIKFEMIYQEDNFKMLSIKNVVSGLRDNHKKLFHLYLEDLNNTEIRTKMEFSNMDVLKTTKYKLLKHIKDGIKNIDFDNIKIVK